MINKLIREFWVFALMMFLGTSATAGGMGYINRVTTDYQTSGTTYDMWTLVSLSNVSNSSVDVEIDIYEEDGSLRVEDSNSWVYCTNCGELAAPNFTEPTSGSTATFTLEPKETILVFFWHILKFNGYGEVRWSEASGEPSVPEALIGQCVYRVGVEDVDLSYTTTTFNGGKPF